MSQYNNVTVYSTGNDSKIAFGAHANITDDAEQATVWGGEWDAMPIVGRAYRLSAGGLLDWTGQLQGGEGTTQSPYSFSVTDSERERRTTSSRHHSSKSA